jgi:allophanate hydrolase subunit 1
LAWLIDIQREQIWLWQGEELPIVYAGHDIFPRLARLLNIDVAAVIDMTQQHQYLVRSDTDLRFRKTEELL